jgi:TPR repeat protein
MVRNVTIAMVTLGLGIACAQANDAPVTDCDKYAANSLDPQRKAPGVNLMELDPKLAIPACESALQKYPDSARFMYQLGRGYHRSDKVAAAALWYEKAMEHGSAFGEAALALLYMSGLGVPKDVAKAVDMTRDAAEKGVVIAQNALAYMYANGVGVIHDNNKALVWYRKAAEQGAPNAQLSLGIAYEEGDGVKQDLEQAAMWYRKAAAWGLDDAKKRLAGVEARQKSQAK